MPDNRTEHHEGIHPKVAERARQLIIHDTNISTESIQNPSKWISVEELNLCAENRFSHLIMDSSRRLDGRVEADTKHEAA